MMVFIAPSSEFELIAITYTHRRVDHWVEQLHALLSSVSDRQVWDKRGWSGHQLAIKTWTYFTELLYRRDVEATKFREQIVQRAYECVVSAEVHALVFEAKTGPKLWYALKSLARPIIDCRMIWCIASRQPQFCDVRISLVPPRSKTSISPEFQIDLSDAWARLISTSPPASELRMIAKFGEQFKRHCAKSYNLHAEIQLYMHYENSNALTPTLCYFGCSKKACLLCEGFLQALPSPITTRGRHGICYRAWGVPSSTSAGAGVALIGLEKMLVSRIKTHLHDSVRADKTHFAPPVPQSTLVSDFSDSTLQDLLQREKKVESGKKAEMARREERLIL